MSLQLISIWAAPRSFQFKVNLFYYCRIIILFGYDVNIDVLCFAGGMGVALLNKPQVAHDVRAFEIR